MEPDGLLSSRIIVLVCCSISIGVVSTAGSRAEAQARSSLGRVEQAMCAYSDAQGDSYRPFFCDPRCDCLSVQLPQLDPTYLCQEDSPGEFSVRAPDTADVYCQGVCSFDHYTGCSDDSGCLSNYCFYSGQPPTGSCRLTQESCVVNSDCPVINNVCVSDDASANPIGTCQYYFDCSTESCAPGFVCDSFLTNKCTAPLQNEPECNPPDGRLANLVVCATVPSLPRVIGLSGVAAPDSPGMVQCETSASTSPINSNDALECIAEIEAALNSVCQ